VRYLSIVDQAFKWPCVGGVQKMAKGQAPQPLEICADLPKKGGYPAEPFNPGFKHGICLPSS